MMEGWLCWLAPCSEAHIAATKDILADGAPGVSTAHRASTENHALFFLYEENYEYLQSFYPSSFIPESKTLLWQNAHLGTNKCGGIIYVELRTEVSNWREIHLSC